MQQRIECRGPRRLRDFIGPFASAARAEATRPLLLLLLLAACAIAPLARRHDEAAPATPHAPMEWPSEYEGRPLRPLALSAVEQRFAAAFPGAIGRFSDGERLLVLRDVERPTRMLHPAADCYRGLGYRVRGERLESDGERRLWRCFAATRPGHGELRVCERIEDLDPQGRGAAWTDSSAWFWDAALGRSAGPWRAVTRVEAL